MAYFKAKLKGDGDEACLFFKPFLTGNAGALGLQYAFHLTHFYWPY
jgi:hypothetical protein